VQPSLRLTFFFSSRRRHTRLQGDWSSDVCSSDLAGRRRGAAPHPALLRGAPLSEGADPEARLPRPARLLANGLRVCRAECDLLRSEERRVGKECGTCLSGALL